jgi:ferredoxin
MESLINKAKEILSEAKAEILFGYEKGTGSKARPVIISTADDAAKLIFDEFCIQNLANYLTKKDFKKYKKIAIVSPLHVVKSILQLASENQIQEDRLIMIGMTPDGQMIDIPDFKKAEQFVKEYKIEADGKENELIEKIKAMSTEERFAFWTETFADCTKCYACRSACSLCYCERCTVECNNPQWIPTAAHTQGNLEWHIMRAMHLAGRCVDCKECARACPVDIPLNLITKFMTDSILEEFGTEAGTLAEKDSTLSSFKSDDQEHFIK